MFSLRCALAKSFLGAVRRAAHQLGLKAKASTGVSRHRWLATATGLLVCVLAPSAAPAEDLKPAPWRSLAVDGTTWQKWSFDSGAGGAPDAFKNPYGKPVALPSEDGFWEQVYPPTGGKIGVWKLESTEKKPMKFEIPNIADPTKWKNVWLQVTYGDPKPGGIIEPPLVRVKSGDGAEELPSDEELTGLPNGWWHLLRKYKFDKQPAKVVIEISNPEPYQFSVVDQVVVDTQCIPEPSGFALLAIGSLAYAGRRFAAN